MGTPLSNQQLEKYAARLQGRRLLPIFREWQIKRAIRKLVSDGSLKALEALKDASTMGLLAKPPYKKLLIDTLINDPRCISSKHAFDYLKDSLFAISIRNVVADKVGSNALDQKKPSLIKDRGEPRTTQILPPPETFSSSLNPIKLLQSKLNDSIPTSQYRQELKDLVHADSRRFILQQICELWASSSQPQLQLLTELLEYIELLPKGPLVLRVDVALKCRLEYHLADDGQEIAAYLVESAQQKKKKNAVIRAIHLIRNSALKDEICGIWYKEFKCNRYNPDLDEILCALDYLPEGSMEQRVFIALACNKPQRLSLEKSDVLTFLLPLLDHKRLGSQAKLAINMLQDPGTLEALAKLRRNSHALITNFPQEEQNRLIDETCENIILDNTGRGKSLSSEKPRINQDTLQADSDYPINEKQQDTHDHDPDLFFQANRRPSSALGRQESINPSRDLHGIKHEYNDACEYNYEWIEKLDHYVRLEYNERLDIISQIAQSDRSIDDWIEELLHQQEPFSSDEEFRPYSSNSEWFDDISFASLHPGSDTSRSSKTLQPSQSSSSIKSIENQSVPPVQMSRGPHSSNNQSQSTLDIPVTTVEAFEPDSSFPFVYKTKADILRITNCHPSALKQAAKRLKCKAPFTLVEADRLAYALTGDASIRRVYMRRLQELGSQD